MFLEERSLAAPVGALVVGALLAGACGDDAMLGAVDAGPDAASRAPQAVPRTVSIELLQTVERVIEPTDQGAFRFGPREELSDVEVCVAQQRPAFASFEPFAPLRPPICARSVAGEAMRLDGLPANADLIITYEKDGFIPLASTFRTDEHDIALPWWSDGPVYYTPMLREQAFDPWLEPAPLAPGGGFIAAWVQAVGVFEEGPGAEQLVSDVVGGVAPADGVEIAIDSSTGERVSDTRSLRDRPRFVALPEDLYRVRFIDPVIEIVPVGVQEQFLTTGFPIDDFTSIEVPVLDGYLSLALVDGYCPLPPDPHPEFSDLPTCTL